METDWRRARMDAEHSPAGGLHVLDPTWEDLDSLLVRAIDGGVTAASPGLVPPGLHVVLAAGVAGRYASVIVLRRDPEEWMVLLDDTYFLTQDETDRWIPPRASSGGSNHEWILRRPERGADYVDWRAAELVLLGGQW